MYVCIHGMPYARMYVDEYFIYYYNVFAGLRLVFFWSFFLHQSSTTTVPGRMMQCQECQVPIPGSAGVQPIL